jgi:hypothetical protein
MKSPVSSAGEHSAVCSSPPASHNKQKSASSAKSAASLLLPALRGKKICKNRLNFRTFPKRQRTNTAQSVQ